MSSSASVKNALVFTCHQFGMIDENIEEIRRQLAELLSEHRDLDDVINRISADPLQDQLQLQRLKKRKLSLKDQITTLENQLIPDIIA